MNSPLMMICTLVVIAVFSVLGTVAGNMIVWKYAATSHEVELNTSGVYIYQSPLAQVHASPAAATGQDLLTAFYLKSARPLDTSN